MDVVLPSAPAPALLVAGFAAAAAMLFLAARLTAKASTSVGLPVAAAAAAGGILARVVIDQLLDVGGFALSAMLSWCVGTVAGILATRVAETAVLFGVGAAIGSIGARRRGSTWLAVAAVAAGISGLFGLPGSGAAAYATSPASLPDWLIVVDTLGRHAAWASCLAGTVIGGAASGQGQQRRADG